jgi:K(+)-stimulated pyrophosphate-energized sodium pump
MNILIKLTCLVGLVIAPILGEISGNGHHAEANDNEKTEVVLENTDFLITEDNDSAE